MKPVSSSSSSSSSRPMDGSKEPGLPHVIHVHLSQCSLPGLWLLLISDIGRHQQEAENDWGAFLLPVLPPPVCHGGTLLNTWLLSSPISRVTATHLYPFIPQEVTGHCSFSLLSPFPTFINRLSDAPPLDCTVHCALCTDDTGWMLLVRTWLSLDSFHFLTSVD